MPPSLSRDRIASIIEAVLYRCYDGPAAEDASFAVARGVFG